jgi:hypothetical protein
MRSPEIKPAKMNWRVGNSRVFARASDAWDERNNSEPSNKREFIQVIMETMVPEEETVDFGAKAPLGGTRTTS